MPQEKLEAIQPRSLGSIKFFPKVLTPTRALELMPEVIDALQPLLDSGVKMDQLKAFAEGGGITDETFKKLFPAIGSITKSLVNGRLLKIALGVLAESFVYNQKASPEKIFLRNRDAIDLAFSGESVFILMAATWIAVGVTYFSFFPGNAQAAEATPSQNPSAP